VWRVARSAVDDTRLVWAAVQRLRSHREQLGLTRTEVARRMGSTRAVVTNLETRPDRACAHLSTLLRYGRAIDLPIALCVALPGCEPPPAAVPAQR
jgi:DNA-binding XRE family transcriptional regulator